MQQFKGVYTALITPLHANGELDKPGLRLLIRQQIAANVNGIVILGTTGEAPTLSTEEKYEIISIAREETFNKTQLIVGTGSYSTAQTVANTLQAEKMGADACLIVTPYYNKPTQEGIFLHFSAVTNASSLPIIVYNIHGRTGTNIQTPTLKKIASLPNIASVKEASGDIHQMTDVIFDINRTLKSPMTILSGDDSLMLPLLALGGHGVISVASNLFPEKIVSLFNAASKNEWDEARNLHFELLDLFKGLFIETNPIPVKYAMQLLGLPSGPCRLPLSNLSDYNKITIEKMINNYMSSHIHWS